MINKFNRSVLGVWAVRKILRSINVMAGIIVVSLSWLLISRFDILGGVLLNLIGEFLVFSMLAFIAHRKWGARV